MRRLIALGACLLGALAVPSLAGASKTATSPSGGLTARWLWATVDVCATGGSSDTVGIRGSMPGTGDAHEQLYMLFRLQYRASSGAWQNIGSSTGYVAVGSSAYVSREAGRDFNLASTTATGTVLRGEVYFDWRIGKRIEYHTQLATTAGHLVTAGASPPGFSAASCTIS